MSDSNKKEQEEYDRYNERQKRLSRLLIESEKLVKDFKNIAYQGKTYDMTSEKQSKLNEIEAKWHEIEIETYSKLIIDSLIETDMRMSGYSGWFSILFKSFELQEDGSYEVNLYHPHKVTGKRTINMQLSSPIKDCDDPSRIVVKSVGWKTE